MHSSPKEDENIISKDPFYFLCACGAQFQLIHHYQQHLQKVHNLKNAIITPETQAVKQELPSKVTLKTQQPSKKLDNQVDKIEEQAKNSIKSWNHQMRGKQERKGTIKTLLKGRLIKNCYDFRQKTVTWQGFKLIKNQNCHHEPYYCGNCITIFFVIEDYVTHCLEDCRTLIHTDSSHTITLQTKEEDGSEDVSDNESQRSQKKQQGNPHETKYPHPLDYQPFKEIISGGLDHRKHPFFCGQCKTIFTILSYFRHFRQNHDQNMGQLSSHIIIRCRIGLVQKFIYLSPKVRWPNLEKKYFCLCNPTQKIKMRQLIQHIKAYHKGVSPFYQIPTLTSMKKSQMNGLLQIQSANLKILDEKSLLKKLETAYSCINELSDYHIFHDLFYKAKDHRKSLPFSCGYCPLLIIKTPLSYKKHLQTHLFSQLIVPSSHVILLLQNGNEHKKVYLSPTIKWSHDEAIYFCPCSIGNKMSMESLIIHIVAMHHSMSPLYRMNRAMIAKLKLKCIRQEQ